MGADSTSSLSPAPGRFHFFNHNQKIFEIGEKSTLAILTWGLGGLGEVSYRTLIADLAHELAETPAATVRVASRWIQRAWPVYATTQAGVLAELKALAARPPHDPKATPATPNARSKDEENVFQNAKLHWFVGFCIGGYLLPDRKPGAYHITFDPLVDEPGVEELPPGDWWFATPNVIDRLMKGADHVLRHDILASPHWTGSKADLDKLLSQHQWQHPILPIRDAIDYVHTGIFSTIKAMKFSSFNQICGGRSRSASSPLTAGSAGSGTKTGMRPSRKVCHDNSHEEGRARRRARTTSSRPEVGDRNAGAFPEPGLLSCGGP